MDGPSHTTPPRLLLLQTNEKGQVTVKGAVLKQMEDLKEETGLTCCICREGYRNQPTKVRWFTVIYKSAAFNGLLYAVVPQRNYSVKAFTVDIIMPVASIGRVQYEMIGGVCLSVCLSVAFLDLTRERKGLGSPKLAGWNPFTRVTPVLRSKCQGHKVTGQCLLMQLSCHKSFGEFTQFI